MCVFAIYVDSIIFHSDYFEHFSCVVTVVIKVYCCNKSICHKSFFTFFFKSSIVYFVLYLVLILHV